VLLSMLFYTMPIIYPIEQMPTEYHGLFLWDPFYYFLKLFKVLMYEGTIPALSEWYVPLGITAVSLVVAFGVLKWKERDIIYRL
jgi:ABC-type polysaccharide/polyol phosphate export permease